MRFVLALFFTVLASTAALAGTSSFALEAGPSSDPGRYRVVVSVTTPPACGEVSLAPEIRF